MAPWAALIEVGVEVGVLALQVSGQGVALVALLLNGIVGLYPDRAAIVLLAHAILALVVDSMSSGLPSRAVAVLAAPLAPQPVPWT